MVIKKHNVICNIIFLYIIFISLYFTNADYKGCSCKRENNKLKSEENNPCCKSCKCNKFQDVNSGSKEIKRDKAIKKSNKKNNINYDEIRKISNKKEMTYAAAEDFVDKQKEVGREQKLEKERIESKKKRKKKRQKEEAERKEKEEDKRLKEEEERLKKKEEEERKLREEERKKRDIEINIKKKEILNLQDKCWEISGEIEEKIVSSMGNYELDEYKTKLEEKLKQYEDNKKEKLNKISEGIQSYITITGEKCYNSNGIKYTSTNNGSLESKNIKELNNFHKELLDKINIDKAILICKILNLKNTYNKIENINKFLENYEGLKQETIIKLVEYKNKLEKRIREEEEMEQEKKEQLLKKQKELSSFIKKINNEYQCLEFIFLENKKEKDNKEGGIKKSLKDVETQINNLPINEINNLHYKYNEFNNKIEEINNKIEKFKDNLEEIKNKITTKVNEQILKYINAINNLGNFLKSLNKEPTKSSNKKFMTEEEIKKGNEKYNYDIFKKKLESLKDIYLSIVKQIEDHIQTNKNQIENKIDSINKLLNLTKSLFNSFNIDEKFFSEKTKKKLKHKSNKGNDEKNNKYIIVINNFIYKCKNLYNSINDFYKKYNDIKKKYNNEILIYISFNENIIVDIYSKTLNYKNYFDNVYEEIKKIKSNIEKESSKNLSTMEGENKILNNYIKKYLEEFKKENEEFLKKIKSYKKGYHYYNEDNNVKNLYNTYQQYEKIFSKICNKNDGNIRDKYIKYIELKEGIEEIKEKKKETFENFIKKINKSDKYLSILKTIIKELVLQKYFNLDDIAFLFKEKNEENNQNILIQNKELDMDFKKIKAEIYKIYNKHLKDINEIQEFKAVEDLYKKTLPNIKKIKTIIENIEKIKQKYSSYKYIYGEKTKNPFVIIEKKLYYPLDSLEIHNIPINFEDFEKIIEEDITKKQSNSEELIKKIKNNKEQTTNYIKNMKLKINESEQNLKEFVETFVNCYNWATENNYRTEETPSDREKYDDLYKNLSKILNKEKDIFEILLNKKINRNERDLIELASETTETIDKMTDFFEDLFINIFHDKINNIFKGINKKYSEQKEEKKRQKEEFREYFKNCKFNIENIKLLSEKLDNKLKEYEQYINN